MNDDEQMDVDPDHVVESYEEDDNTPLSNTTTVVTNPFGSISGREPLSKFQSIDIQ